MASNSHSTNLDQLIKFAIEKKTNLIHFNEFYSNKWTKSCEELVNYIESTKGFLCKNNKLKEETIEITKKVKQFF